MDSKQSGGYYGAVWKGSIMVDVCFLADATISFPLLVSWADMIAVAGAEAVSICGGPTIPVILGRRDSV